MSRIINRRQALAGIAAVGAQGLILPHSARSQAIFAPPSGGGSSGGGGGGGGEGLRDEYAGLTKYYIDPNDVSGNASDSNDGTSESSPWATLDKWRTSSTAGSITFIRGGTHLVTSGAASGPLLNPDAGGTSEAIKVLANYPGETVVLKRTGTNRELVGVETTSGSTPKDYVWWDGLTFDGDDRNATIGYWHNDNGTAPEGLRFRHCTFQNVVLDTDNGQEGGSVSAGGKGHLYMRSSHDSYIENCLFKNISMLHDNTNLDCIVSYDCDNLTFRYNQFDNCNATACYRIKQQGDNSRTIAGVFYRNHIKPNCDSKSIVIGDGWPGSGDASRECTYHFYENLVENGRAFGADRDPAEYGLFVDWLFWNNTMIGGGVQGAGGNDTGWVDTSGFAIWNNISFNAQYAYDTSGSSASNPTWDPNTFYDDSKTNYNMWINETGSFTAHHQYPSVTYTEAQWKALGFDLNSIFTSTDPFEDEAAGDYRLASGSAAIGAGKVGGVSGGESVDLGCFYDEYWLPDVGPSPM